jgi:hypothetical protein
MALQFLKIPPVKVTFLIDISSMLVLKINSDDSALNYRSWGTAKRITEMQYLSNEECAGALTKVGAIADHPPFAAPLHVPKEVAWKAQVK